MNSDITLSGRGSIAGRPLFSHIDLTVPNGRWTALLGTSGIGKSSLLRLLAALPTTLDFKGETHAPSPDQIAWMAQDDLLFPWKTVIGNVVLGATLRGDEKDTSKAIRLIEQVGLSKQINQKPNTLSGGERQRAALARTLMEDRPFVFLDEPFSALDAKTRVEVQDLARQMLTGRTVLMVTHDPLEAARLADHAFLLTQDGLTPLPLSDHPHPRAPEAHETASVQAEIYAMLRAQ